MRSHWAAAVSVRLEGMSGASVDASVEASISSNGSEHVVRCSHLFGLMMRHARHRRPVRRCADRVQDFFAGL